MVLAQVKLKLAAIEEAVSLSNWTTITICRALSLQNGVLSATVLSLIPMILPFEWQSLFLPVLPWKMLDFLDAPVPFVVGILHKPADLKMKSNNLVHVNLADDRVKASSLPALPKQRELINRLGPLHARLSSDKTAAKKHPVYKCNKWQIDAATQFLTCMRQHLESLCSNLSYHSITYPNKRVRKTPPLTPSSSILRLSFSLSLYLQVSLLVKDSYIDSFPYRDRQFVTLLAFLQEFVDTQMFTLLSDTRLSRPPEY
ncbi:putative cDENN domain, tripartite DENN domain, DENN domain lobe protein [Helianthus annuus]|nr:putative cDENN domain, tripartite DENN domain, DENN domain lobe protein [Helianthus annuus]